MEKTIMADTTEARAYLDKHKILPLFNNLTAQLFFNRPEDPKTFLIKILQHLEDSRVSMTTPPLLFDDTNIESIFSMMDPTNTGTISVQQYNHAMETLGIADFEKTEGEANRISYEYFASRAKTGVATEAKTYHIM